MSIEIREKFEVAAPIETVWRFVMDPNQVAPCLPGAKLEEVVDERHFLGAVKIKIGAITAQYKGKVELTKIDEQNRVVEMAAEAQEKSGGSAKALVTSRLSETAVGTEVVVEATADLTGKVMQVGSRMVEGVSKQLFQQFAKRLKKKLEGEGVAAASVAAETTGAAAAGAVAAPPQASRPAPEHEEEALSIIPLILRAIWDAIVGFFRALFGGKSKG
jgi:carbon monoxide dehydrogenase subunit G